MRHPAGAAIDTRYCALYFGSSSAEDAAAPYERALALARPDLEELFEEWAARGHVPIVAFDQPHEEVEGTLIEDLSSPDDGDPLEASFRAQHHGGPCAVALTRNLDESQYVELELLVTDRVLESELEPILQQVSELLRSAFAPS
jgi:hypothetical protein